MRKRNHISSLVSTLVVFFLLNSIAYRSLNSFLPGPQLKGSSFVGKADTGSKNQLPWAEMESEDFCEDGNDNEKSHNKPAYLGITEQTILFTTAFANPPRIRCLKYLVHLQTSQPLYIYKHALLI